MQYFQLRTLETGKHLGYGSLLYILGYSLDQHSTSLPGLGGWAVRRSRPRPREHLCPASLYFIEPQRGVGSVHSYCQIYASSCYDLFVPDLLPLILLTARLVTTLTG